MSDVQEFLKKQEGFRSKAYPDNGQYSIGYGTRTTDPQEIAGLSTIDEAEASRRLLKWTEGDQAYIQKAGKREGLEWNKQELNALTSFTYNLGRGNLDKLIDDRDKETIASKINLYNRAGGEVNAGLVKRRKAESEMFSSQGKAEKDYFAPVESKVPLSEIRSKGGKFAQVGEEPTIAQLWDASTSRNWTHNALERYEEAETQEFDPEFRVTDEQSMQLRDKGYTDEEVSFMQRSSSDGNFQFRLTRVESDRKTKQLIEQGGWTGSGIEVAAAMTDPLLIPTMLVGGVGSLAKFNTVKAVAYGAIEGAGYGLATEYLLAKGDTQRTMEDLIISGAGGALLGGGLAGISAKLGGIREANQAQRAYEAGVADLSANKAYHLADEALAQTGVDPVTRKVVLTEQDILTKLRSEVGEPRAALSAKKVKALKDEFRTFKKAQRVKIAALEANRFIKPAARGKQIAQLDGAIKARELKLAQAVEENSLLVDSNSKLSALQQGRIPKSLQSRYDELKRESGDFSSVKAEAPAPIKPRPKEVDEEGVPVSEDLSVGAMQVKTKYKDIQTFDDLLEESEVPEIMDGVASARDFALSIPRINRVAHLSKGLRSLSTVLDTAAEPILRGLSAMMFKNGTRTIAGHQSAEELAETLFFRNVPDFFSELNAFNKYAKSVGIGIFGKGRVKARAEFDNLVVLEQAKGNVTTNKASPNDSPILAAAKARARVYERSLANNKDYNVVGFNKIEHSNSYHSVVYDGSKMSSLNAEADDIRQVIALSYQTGGIKLPRESALRLAELQIARSNSYKAGDGGSYAKVFPESEFRRLDEELEKAGVDVTTRQEIRSYLFNAEDMENLSPRAMFSLKPDLTQSAGGVRMVDLLDTSVDRVFKYASDSSANAGLASQGFRSRHQLMRALEEGVTVAKNKARVAAKSPNLKEAAAGKAELDKLNSEYYQKMMEDGVSLMYREPLDGKNDGIEDFMKGLRKQTIITRLRSTGLTSLPEFAAAAVRNGALNTLRSIPESRFFDLRTTSIEKDKFMKDFSDVFSSTGHQEAAFGRDFYNGSDFDDATKTAIGQAVDRLQGKMLNVTMTVNLFRSIQHGGEEVVARSIVKNLQGLAKAGEITPVVKRSLMGVGGLAEDQVTEVMKALAKAGDGNIFDTIRTLDPKTRNALAVAVRNTIGSSFMRIGIGESIPYANREMGKMFTSLLNFSIGSWEKMVIRGFTSEQAQMATIFMGQAAVATAAQYAYVYTRAAGKEGQYREGYLDKKLESDDLMWGAMGRMGYLAAPMLPFQMLASARLLPDEMMASPDQTGFTAASVAPITFGMDLGRATGSAAELIGDEFNDDYMEDKTREKHWRNMRRVLPWVDSPIYNATLGQFD